LPQDIPCRYVALFVPIVGIVSPNDVGIVPSIGLLVLFAIVWGIGFWPAVVALVALDVIGGAVATFTVSTASYYSGKPALRRVFIGLHVLHPGLLAALYPSSATLIALTGLYAVAAAYAVDALESPDTRRLVAAVVVALGVTLFSIMGVPSPLIAWFAPIFLVKLVGGFAVGRR